MNGFHIHVYMLNEHFSQEHADANYDGQESPNNKFFDWEDEMNLKGEISFEKETEKDTYKIKGYKGEEYFEIPVPQMRIFSFVNSEGVQTEIACSESLYEKHELNVEGKSLILTLKGEPYANPIPGIYIASKEFPKELIVGD
jgi:hypothetical protein